MSMYFLAYSLKEVCTDVVAKCQVYNSMAYSIGFSQRQHNTRNNYKTL